MQFLTKTGHGYLSTACFHGKHGDCRLDCKFCSSPCLCLCHWQSSRDIIKEKLVEELEEIK